MRRFFTSYDPCVAYDVWPCDVWATIDGPVYRYTGLGTWECIK